MPVNSSPDVEGIRKTLSEIQRLAGSLAEADRQRASRSTDLVRINVFGSEGDLTVTSPPKDLQPSNPSAPLALATRIGAVCGVLFVAGLAWHFSGETTATRETAPQPPQSAAQSSGAVGSAGTIAIAAATKPAGASTGPLEPAEVTALAPAMPRPGQTAPTPANRDGPTTDSPATNSIWQKTALTVTSLLAMGRIVEARELLLKAEPDTDPDAAWALARTFDPRYVARIAKTDAAPDVALATHWYRKWYALALAKGRISGDVNVERILKGMQ